MSTETEKKPTRGRRKKTIEEYMAADEKKREKALQRYYEKKEECKEQSKINQQRYRELYKFIKELVKEDKIKQLTDEQLHHLKELVCLV